MNAFELERSQKEYEAEDGIALLRVINAGNPENLARLEALIGAGHSVQELFDACNEIGECVYDGPKDPNSLNNRYRTQFEINLNEAVTIGLTEETNEFHHPDGFKVQESTVHRVRETLQHATRARVLHALNKPKLETHEDFIAYFESFPPAVLDAILRNLHAFELNEGCVAPCFKTCSVARIHSIKRSLPYETLLWVLDRIEQMDRPITPMHYWGTDAKYYRSSDEEGNPKMGVDVISEFHRREFNRYVSTSFGLDRYTVEFIGGLMARGIPIRRISRLSSGNEPDDLMNLAKKIKEQCFAEEDRSVEQIAETLEPAFSQGDKPWNKKKAGREVASEIDEAELSVRNYNCRTGVVLGPDGFKASVTSIATKVSPYHDIQWPIVPNPDGSITIPCMTSMDETVLPSFQDPLGRPVFFGPRTFIINEVGEILHETPLHPLEENLRRVNKDLKELGKTLEALPYVYLYGHKVEGVEQAEEACRDLTLASNTMLESYAQFLEKRAELYETYRADILVLHKLALVDADVKLRLNSWMFMVEDFIDELIHVYQQSGKQVSINQDAGSPEDILWELDLNLIEELSRKANKALEITLPVWANILRINQNLHFRADLPKRAFENSPSLNGILNYTNLVLV